MAVAIAREPAACRSATGQIRRLVLEILKTHGQAMGGTVDRHFSERPWRPTRAGAASVDLRYATAWTRAKWVGAICLLPVIGFEPGGAVANALEFDTVSPVLPRSVNPELEAGSPEFFKICRDQTYALCAVASCFVFNQVAYCKCDVEHGDSISLPFEFNGQDVCDVNAQGPANGFMVSTFSLPDSVLEGGDTALYTCRAGTSDGAYAQCDGGLCFTSTEASPSFFGFDEPLAADQIICSCPITTANPDQATFGYQIAGPFPCEDSFFENCRSTESNSRTGSTIPVGAPTGVPRILTRLLNGPPVPQINLCPSPKRG